MSGHDPVHFLIDSAAEIGCVWDSLGSGGIGLGLLGSYDIVVQFSTCRMRFLQLGRLRQALSLINVLVLGVGISLM